MCNWCSHWLWGEKGGIQAKIFSKFDENYEVMYQKKYKEHEQCKL